jgi:ketosteroid isomerase-like protein
MGKLSNPHGRGNNIVNAQVNQSANTEYLKIAEKWSSILPNKDMTVLREIYHENAETWHNYDRKNMTMQELAALVEVVFSSFSKLAIKNIRRSAIEKGFVQQHDIVGTHINGQSLNFSGCIVVTVEAGKISRLEEYIDPAPVFALLSPH